MPSSLQYARTMQIDLDALEVTKNAAAERYELPVGDDMAFLEYKERGHVAALVHTEVPERLEGRGIGNRLVRGALDLARHEGLKIIPACAFVKAFIGRHPEYADIVQE